MTNVRRPWILLSTAVLLPALSHGQSPPPAPTGNIFMDSAMSACSRDNQPGTVSFQSCVSSNIFEQAVNPMKTMDNVIKGANDIINIYADMQAKLPYDPLTESITSWFAKVTKKVTEQIEKFTEAFTLTQGKFRGPDKDDVGSDMTGVSDAETSDTVDWSSSRTTCCGSEVQRFMESTEQLVKTLRKIVTEIQYMSHNIITIGQIRQAMAAHKITTQEESYAARLNALAEIRKRVSLARTMIANHVAYAGDPRLGDGGVCSVTADNMLNSIPLATTWMGGTHEINTIQLTQRPLINPNLLDGKREPPKDAFERWLLANPQFHPKNLWSVFTTPHIGTFDGWTLKLAALGDYGGTQPEDAAITPDTHDNAPLVKAEPKADPAGQGLNTQNLAYEPTAHAVNMMVNMLLDAESVPPSLNPAIRDRGNRSKIFYIFSNVPAYTANEAGSGTTIGYRPWRDWAAQKNADNPFERNFMAEMAVREMHSAMLKRVFTSYMMEHYRLFKTPEGKTAREVVFTGFADAFLPISEQNNNKLFANFNIQTDQTQDDWAKRLGLEVQGAYTEAQRRDMTISLLTHPHMQEIVTRTHGDDLRRLDIKYLNTLAYLRKKRLDELNKQRMLLIIIAEQRAHQERASQAAHQSARTIP